MTDTYVLSIPYCGFEVTLKVSCVRASSRSGFKSLKGEMRSWDPVLSDLNIIFIVSVQIERQHSIKIQEFLAPHNGKFWPNIVQKLQYFPQFIAETDHRCQKSVFLCSNQEWRFICVYTVIASDNNCN